MSTPSLLPDSEAPHTPAQELDPRFSPPPPSPLKRLALVLFIILLFLVAWRLRHPAEVQPRVVYADRYSKEFKYRPAASPVITETMKDGRLLIRGALPTEKRRHQEL